MRSTWAPFLDFQLAPPFFPSPFFPSLVFFLSRISRLPFSFLPSLNPPNYLLPLSSRRVNPPFRHATPLFRFTLALILNRNMEGGFVISSSPSTNPTRSQTVRPRGNLNCRSCPCGNRHKPSPPAAQPLQATSLSVT